MALQGNDVGQERVMTYSDVLSEVCRVVRAADPPDAAPERSMALAAEWDQTVVSGAYEAGKGGAVFT